MSCILYGCEAWLNVPLKMVEAMYMKAVKALLGVRITTPNDLCLVEAGLRPLSGIVKSRQQKFFLKMLETRSDMSDDPFIHAFGITREMNSVMWRYIETITSSGDTDFIADEVSKIKESIMDQPPTASKFRTYQTLNPTLEVHPLYSTKSPTIPDYLRINFTRYRLSSHRLKIEIGLWRHTHSVTNACVLMGPVYKMSYTYLNARM